MLETYFPPTLRREPSQETHAFCHTAIRFVDQDKGTRPWIDGDGFVPNLAFVLGYTALSASTKQQRRPSSAYSEAIEKI